MLRELNVDAHFLNPCPKSHTEESPMKSKAQRPAKKAKWGTTHGRRIIRN